MTRAIAFALVTLLSAASACKEVNTQGVAGALVAARPGTKAPTRPRTAPAPGPSAPAPTGEESGKLAGLTAAHNELRAAVGVGAVTWSNELGRFAQAWADHLAANGCTLAHRPANAQPYGENLYWSSNAATAAAVMATWAAEKSAYDHATNACSGVCGHYTQIVWSATTEIGCGRATCGAAEVWVCNYAPRGNVLGQAPY